MQSVFLMTRQSRFSNCHSYELFNLKTKKERKALTGGIDLQGQAAPMQQRLFQNETLALFCLDSIVFVNVT